MPCNVIAITSGPAQAPMNRYVPSSPAAGLASVGSAQSIGGRADNEDALGSHCEWLKQRAG